MWRKRWSFGSGVFEEDLEWARKKEKGRRWGFGE
jgi:hypothetical protein